MKDLMKNEDFDLGLGDVFDELFRPVFYEKKPMHMKTDIKENENEYELDIDMPGFKKEEIDVTLNNGYLKVSAKKDIKEEAEKKNNYVRRERSYSSSRSYFVGDKIKEEDIKAKYENGVLNLIIPKEKPKELPNHKINID